MDLTEAIKERIKKYYDSNFDEDDTETNKLTPAKYNRKYFDDFEQELLGGREDKNAKSK